ncbi:hypothetical protein NDU88_003751 [Pleurodeles waltl]|uniref:Uncharacterized protein n=1 Tax=Pleurodeles waltl TaxID=8319 RepID=A0AAV7SGU6_PLEWA|nr:hypothetical protein NDU88_003751 [Pleurodeles waltl]
MRGGSRQVNERVRMGCGLMLGVGTGHLGKRGHLRRPRRPGRCAWAEDPPELHMRGRYKLGQPVEMSVPPQNHHIKGPDREASQAKRRKQAMQSWVKIWA